MARRRQFVVKLDMAVLRENLNLTEEQLPDDATDDDIQRLINVWIYKGERAVRDTQPRERV
jgi:hypothetical protein